MLTVADQIGPDIKHEIDGILHVKLKRSYVIQPFLGNKNPINIA